MARIGKKLTHVSLIMQPSSDQLNAASPPTPPKARLQPRHPADLSDNCFACHGPDKNKRKAKLRLDDRDSAIEKEAIVPGKPEESELVKRIFTNDPEEMMPPPESHKTLAQSTSASCSRSWIAQAASTSRTGPTSRRSGPAVPRLHDAAPGQEPDRRVHPRKPRSEDHSASPEADRRTPAPPAQPRPDRPAADAGGGAGVPRRPSSPTPTRSRSTGCSPRPTTASGWPSLARPGPVRRHRRLPRRPEPDVFPYRDYVIDAFNRNKPFDQFTIEQLAGDLLPEPDARAARRHRLQPAEHDDARGRRAAEGVPGQVRRRPRADGGASTWLGSTMGCCECHDHKFDPFTRARTSTRWPPSSPT